MFKNALLFILCLLGLSSLGQSVAGTNFRYYYDPANEIDMQVRLVNEQGKMTVYYRLQKDASVAGEEFRLEWVRFDSYTDKDGVVVPQDSSGTVGKLSFSTTEKQWLLVCRVTNVKTQKTWRYAQVMDAKYPVNGYLEGGDGIVYKPYAVLGQSYTLHVAGNKPARVYFYKADFPVAAPPFSDKVPRQDRFMFADSTFEIVDGQKFMLKSKGMYLVQQDTSKAEGFAFLGVGKSYPKSTRIEDIPDPLIFVSTKEEHDALVLAGADKTKIDKVILDITRDKDRAKNFMRSYFRRVELTNQYFTSFKEGWKTDRGMIYLIFGLPDEVSRTGPNEIWYYKNIKERFTFVKAGSVYDPDNYILQRHSKYTELWFSTVDLWRKSRF